MAEGKRSDGFLLGYRVQVYAAGELEGRERDRLIDAVDDELHDGLFLLAQRLEKRFGVHVVAVDEEATSWIAGGLAGLPSGSEGPIASHVLRPEQTPELPD